MANLSVLQPLLSVPASPTDSVSALGFREAFQRALPAARALDLKDLIAINIDVPTAVTTALGCLPEILKLRERAKALAEFDITQLDELGTFARAAMHAHGEYIAATEPPEALEALNAEGIALRDTLHSDAVTLSRRGLVNGSPLAVFKKFTGYKNLATDLVGLSSLLRNHWAEIATKTAITSAELDRAEALSEQLLMAVGARAQAPAKLAEVAQMRRRMFTVFLNAYDEARRAVSFLRWKQRDLDKIAPSLYAGRAARRNKAERERKRPAKPAAATEPTAPVGSTAAAALPAPPELLGGSPFDIEG